ncbi:MAG TPA: hypothetical protein VG963_17370, partial [Polyangiaceae bacterium]|nr:hypothetical protein [Polyangiaceae bacterium]
MRRSIHEAGGDRQAMNIAHELRQALDPFEFRRTIPVGKAMACLAELRIEIARVGLGDSHDHTPERHVGDFNDQMCGAREPTEGVERCLGSLESGDNASFEVRSMLRLRVQRRLRIATQDDV